MGWGPVRFRVLQVHQPVVQLKRFNKLATILIYEAPTKLREVILLPQTQIFGARIYDVQTFLPKFQAAQSLTLRM